MNVREMFDLTGKVALVTGGSTGLGFQLATALAEAGANVVVASRNLERCTEAAARLQALGSRSLALSLDLAQPAEITQTFQKVLDVYGQIDILVNNSAATDISKPFQPFTLEAWEGMLRVNITGLMLCSQAALEPMKRQGRGKIINNASVYGLVGVDASLYGGSPENYMNNAPYTATKGAVVNLTRQLAVAWAPYGINVNAISPGMFPVEANVRKWPAGTFDRLQQRIPMHRMGGENDLKGAVVFLASAASDYVTGHNLVVDGGWVAW